MVYTQRRYIVAAKSMILILIVCALCEDMCVHFPPLCPVLSAAFLPGLHTRSHTFIYTYIL